MDLIRCNSVLLCPHSFPSIVTPMLYPQHILLILHKKTRPEIGSIAKNKWMNNTDDGWDIGSMRVEKETRWITREKVERLEVFVQVFIAFKKRLFSGLMELFLLRLFVDDLSVSQCLSPHSFFHFWKHSSPYSPLRSSSPNQRFFVVQALVSILLCARPSLFCG